MSVSWQSVRWPDGSSYEGLVNDAEECHVRGVFRYPGGDRYEGEYVDGAMQGFGVYVWSDGTVYRGQWDEHSKMHGCGSKITRQPNGSFIAEEGQFVKDEWAGDAMCTVEQARAAAAEADIAAQMARVFEVRSAQTPAAGAAAKVVVTKFPRAARKIEGASSGHAGAAQQGSGPHPAPWSAPLAAFNEWASKVRARF